MVETAPLQRDIILGKLGQSIFARNLLAYRSLSSTNDMARQLASLGAPEGTVVVAEAQTAGRGRMGRPWVSPRGANLLVSVLLRPRISLDEAFALTMILALAVVEAIKRVTNLKTMIKWPNDLYMGSKKLGGILTEFSSRGKVLGDVVLGLGLNVNWSPGEKEGVLYPATSLMAETGRRVSREDLLVWILKRLEDYYPRGAPEKMEDLYRRWNEISLITGQDVEIITGKGRCYGRALRIDRDGALIIKDEKGKEQKIFSGDVC